MTIASDFHLPSDLRSPGVGRSLVRDALADLPAETVDTALLLVSELVTNTVVHAESPIRLGVRRNHTSLSVLVQDGSELHPLSQSVPSEATGGRGLSLVEALSKAWGWNATPEGKFVWFDL